MPWTIPDHEKSAIDALNLGVISGDLSVLADVPEPFQSNQHQARVSALSVLYELGGPDATIRVPWSKTMYDWSAPPPDLFIPKLDGPILKHDGNPTVINGTLMHDDGGTHDYHNVQINGYVRTRNGSTINLYDFEIDGQGGPQCAAGWGGGTINLFRGEVHNAEDGLKDSVNTEQVTVHNLFHRVGAHGDAHQLQSGGATAFHRFSYFDGFYSDGELANAAFIVKHDLGSDEPQALTVEDSYMNGGNYTVFLGIGSRGPASADTFFRRVVWGGDSRYLIDGQPLSAKAPAPGEWDVTRR